MASKRERIILAFQSILLNVPQVSGRVNRTLPDPNARDYTPFIALDWTQDVLGNQDIALMERVLTVQVAINVRGDEPDTLADPIAVTAHGLIMADPTLGGIAIDCHLADVSFEAMGADGSAGKLTHSYDVKYRHSYGDLTA